MMPITLEPPKKDHDPVFIFSKKELQLIKLIGQGCSNEEIRQAFGYKNTNIAAERISDLMALSPVFKSRTECTLYAVQTGLVKLEELELKHGHFCAHEEFDPGFDEWLIE